MRRPPEEAEQLCQREPGARAEPPDPLRGPGQRPEAARQEDSGTVSWISKDQNLLSALNHLGFSCHLSLFGCSLSSALVQYRLWLIQQDSE